jgi:hypothetical protein
VQGWASGRWTYDYRRVSSAYNRYVPTFSPDGARTTATAEVITSEVALEAAVEAFGTDDHETSTRLERAIEAYIAAEREQVRILAALRIATFLQTVELDMTGSYLHGRNGLRNYIDVAVELLDMLGLSGAEMMRGRFIQLMADEVPDYWTRSKREQMGMIYDAIKKHGPVREM